MKKHIFIGAVLILLLSIHTGAYGDNHPNIHSQKDSLLLVRKNREVKLKKRALPLFDVKTPANEIVKPHLFPNAWHPAQDSVPPAILNEIVQRKQILGKDSLWTADLFWVLKPYLLWLQNIDPHFRINPTAQLDYSQVKERQAYKQVKMPGLVLLNINDTLLVNQSVDPLFKRGDQILTINNISSAEYLKHYYNDRYIYPVLLLNNYYFNLAADFKISLVRNEQTIVEVTTLGMPYAQADFQLIKQHEFQTKIFSEAKTGYFIIEEFYPNNNLLINKLRKAILQFKEQGCTSVILDLRGNPGGNGGEFDKLLSLFIDKPTIPYMKSQKLKVSEQTRHDYDFITDSMLGKLVEMPDKDIIKEVTLDPKMYIPGMKYYVLMNKDTGSIAASFCNIMQYNDAAKLVGEPLLHNALKYGDEIDGGFMLPTLLAVTSVSTVEYDEYTKAVDGTLMPDISIPYVAADYLSGKDAMLEKLLEMIKSGNVN